MEGHDYIFLSLVIAFGIEIVALQVFSFLLIHFAVRAPTQKEKGNDDQDAAND